MFMALLTATQKLSRDLNEDVEMVSQLTNKFHVCYGIRHFLPIISNDYLWSSFCFWYAIIVMLGKSTFIVLQLNDICKFSARNKYNLYTSQETVLFITNSVGSSNILSISSIFPLVTSVPDDGGHGSH
jgi:hypothetical protein